MTDASAPMTPEALSCLLASFLNDMRQAGTAEPVVITPDTDLLDDIGIDSLEITEIVYRLEEATGARLALDRIELRHFRCVRELATLVDSPAR